tara:strand:- start:257 stop:520 length:264 start_codon:yes stop_codon:yes gene_type:complete
VCHSISEFRGGGFRLAWAGFTVGDLFQPISTLIPKDDPGSLSPEEYSAIVSYLLRETVTKRSWCPMYLPFETYASRSVIGSFVTRNS